MRYYDGCPDSDLQRLLDAQAAARKRVAAAFPEARVTYFPAEGMHLAFHGYKVVGEFQSDLITCVDKAIEILTEKL